MKKLLRGYAAFMLLLGIALLMFPLPIFTVGLFFYDKFSWLQIAKQGGCQLLCVTLLYLLAAAWARVWRWSLEYV